MSSPLTSTPKSKNENVISDELRWYSLRSGTKVAPAQLKRSTSIKEHCAKNNANQRLQHIFSNSRSSSDSSTSTSTDDLDDENFIFKSNTEKSAPVVFLDLTHYVIVEDEVLDGASSPEDSEKLSERFLHSLKTGSTPNQTVMTPNKKKRKLFTPNHNRHWDDEVCFHDSPDRRKLNAENKEIKLRIPIPTYLIPAEFQKKQPNVTIGAYSSVTGNILDIPKSRQQLKYRTTVAPTTVCEFLESLDGDVVPIPAYSDPHALHYRRNFKREREGLLSRLINLYDQTVFDGKLRDVDVSVSWTKSNLKTGGNCEYLKCDGTHIAEVKLSDGIPSASRLRDTLIAELCCAAAWVLNGDVDVRTGWKLWAETANQRLPELPLIQISDHFEFVYECVICSLRSFARSQPRSTQQCFCARCHGPIGVFLNKKDDKGQLVRCTKSSEFGEFIKKNIKHLTEEYPDGSQVEYVDILSRTFAKIR